jgi:ribonuclease E
MDKNKMLIDATHPEETRVVVLRNGRVEEFDYESAARKPLRGNIYLAKVTRVEPSLQAAFVEYGGNRHGFLAFGEIHPDYYQIPVADRQALLQEEADAEAAAEAEADARAEARERHAAARAARRGGGPAPQNGGSEIETDESVVYIDIHDRDEAEHEAPAIAAESYTPPVYFPVDDRREGEATTPAASGEEPAVDTARHSRALAEDVGIDSGSDAVLAGPLPEAHEAEAPDAASDDHIIEVVEPEVENGDASARAANGEADPVEQVGSEDALEEVSERPRRRMRQYKIQEVIKRRQIMLVQVVKEERGNKGAALTTYLSLAGRYTVLMPNTGRGGGISRKITQPQDRKRLKAIAQDLDVPEGIGLIIRTAGASRTKQEIKRDYEYLLRLWENVRDLTLQAIAPCLVYEEGDLIKRSIRDLYSKDISEITVAGEHAYREANDFMRMLMPSHVQNVTRYDQPDPLFTRYQIERQLNAMFSPYVTLRSGGYLVINQTEALVAIDVNSGKSTREFSIEETALNTNLEASEEIARQLKLRDLAGLIVIDFIDMEEKRNNRSVERRLKDALRFDRARIQVGRISHFGLLEMSRQRLRTGVLEGSTSQCPHCLGTGVIRSTESVALAVLRGLEDHLIKDGRSSLTAVTTASVALYILNQKRSFIADMEARYGISVAVQASERMQGANFAIERSSAPVQAPKRIERAAINMESGFDDEEEHDDEAPLPPAHVVETVDAGEPSDEIGGRPSRRRRRRRGRREEGRYTDAPRTGDGDEPSTGVESIPDEPEDIEVINAESADAESDDFPSADSKPKGAQPGRREARESREESSERRSRRRGRRGGRGRRDRQQPEGSRPQGSYDATYEAGDSAAVEYERVDFGAGPQPTIPGDFAGAQPDEHAPSQKHAGDDAANTNEPATASLDTAPVEAEEASGYQADTAEVNKPVEHAYAEPVKGTTEPEVAPEAPRPAADTRAGKSENGIGRHEEPVAVMVEETVRVIEPAPASISRDEAPAAPAAAETADKPDIAASHATAAPEEAPSDEPPRPARKGWWQRKLGGL